MTDSDAPARPTSRELRVHSVPTRAEQARIVVEIVAIVAAGLWALYTFVYEQRIKPLLEAPAFSVPTIVDQGPTVNGVTFLKIHKRVENTGNVSIDLAAEMLSVYGERVAKQPQPPSRSETSSSAKISADLPRSPVKLLFSFAKLRSGAVGGSPTSFTLPPHSSGEENFLVAIPAGAYPVVLVARKDFVEKIPIVPKIPVRIVRGLLGGYDLKASQLFGEYDSADEYPVRP